MLWIKTSKQLPTFGKEVLIWTKRASCNWAIATLEKYGNKKEKDNRYFVSDITHVIGYEYDSIQYPIADVPYWTDLPPAPYQ